MLQGKGAAAVVKHVDPPLPEKGLATGGLA
jgi:hypothetical protein